MGAEVFHGRVRDGIGCGNLAMTTGPPGRILGVAWAGLVGVLCVCCVGLRRGLVLRVVLSCDDAGGCGMGVLSGD